MFGSWPMLFLAAVTVGQTPPTPLPPGAALPARVVRTMAAPDSSPMHMPTDVAVDAAGSVFVADGANDRVLQFESAGKFVQSIGIVGEQKLNRPVGLSFDAQGRLWIADTGHHRLVVLGAKLELLETIDLPTPANGRPSDPTDVAVTPDGRRTYVVDNDNHRVLVRDNGDKSLTSLGVLGHALGQFEWPFMVCIAPGGEVYVTEAIGARVQRITARNQWAGQVGGWGVEPGQLYRPKGIVCDATGRIFVSDSTLNVVQAFDSRGRFVGVLASGQSSEGPIRFEHPMGMCVDKAGRLYVVELRANRVAVVEVGGPATQPAGGGTHK
jgi:DNA-binding beta-propeller fold protein YncE